ncbi:MAG: beta-ketoacyl-[acyl-carrier-protein] synthase family protein [Planctomycetes bacterium]|nr:beta-ketoacyl-[acyl-carrier-protein] synthase family protein [Planctomycetota bacterium]
MSQRTAVWITGVGAVTPLGSTYEAIAQGFLAGRSVVRPVSSFDVSQHPSRIAGQIPQVPCPRGWDEASFARLDRMEQLVLCCCTNALQNAGYWERRQELRIGLVLGAGAEWLKVWEDDAFRGGTRIYEPERDTESLIHVAQRKLGLTGPAVSVSAACASGNYAIALARRWLEMGWVDLCLTGACDLGVTPLSLAGFGNLRALSRRNDQPEAASRPFDRGRDGFVMGEGGAVFLLEPAPLARKRSAHAYAEVAGCGASSDAFHMVIPSPHPEPAIAAMRQALADAQVDPGAVGYINAHATGTPVGDVAEARVLQAVFGATVHAVPVSSTKSITGHLLTAAAAVEALACLVALERHALPPTINLDDPDPECDLCHVPNQARPHKVRVAVSNSFGFGGSNTCLVLKAA